MSRRSNPSDPEAVRQELLHLIRNFKKELKQSDLRTKVKALVLAFHKLRDLGSSLITGIDKKAARDRVLYYISKYPRTIIEGDELMVVAGISDWPRRVRELRRELGWSIFTGLTLKEMIKEEDFQATWINEPNLKVDNYVLISLDQDREAAHRWKIANDLRKAKEFGVGQKLLRFLRENIGKPVTGEELRYVANDKTEWARRTRELRTEQGWPVATKFSGRPDLPVGVYILEQNRQSPAHDRKIPDPIRRQVLRRDGYRCNNCQWHQELWNKSDPRHLELHHRVHHAKRGENTADNLVTYCTSCHDDIHRNEK